MDKGFMAVLSALFLGIGSLAAKDSSVPGNNANTVVLGPTTVVDLTTGPNASGSINGALFFATDQQPAGTGFIQSFLRVQNKGFEQGYNTDGGFPFDDKHPDNFQHSLLLANLTPFDLNGTAYYKFLLDANQNGPSQHSFTLDRLQIYTSNDPNLTSETFSLNSGIQTLPLGNLAYSLNPNDGTGSYVVTNATGSGKYDAIVYVPVSDFTQSDKYVYLYMAGGDNTKTTGGFEEWSAAQGPAAVPEPSTMALIMISCGAFTFFRRRVRS
jgi:hypothetical protein